MFFNISFKSCMILITWVQKLPVSKIFLGRFCSLELKSPMLSLL